MGPFEVWTFCSILLTGAQRDIHSCLSIRHWICCQSIHIFSIVPITSKSNDIIDIIHVDKICCWIETRNIYTCRRSNSKQKKNNCRIYGIQITVNLFFIDPIHTVHIHPTWWLTYSKGFKMNNETSAGLLCSVCIMKPHLYIYIILDYICNLEIARISEFSCCSSSATTPCSPFKSIKSSLVTGRTVPVSSYHMTNSKIESNHHHNCHRSTPWEFPLPKWRCTAFEY